MTENLLERETSTAKKTKRPPMYNVLLLNDDYTEGFFVADMLAKHFRKSPEEAMAIMVKAHHEQIAYVGTYSKEIAEQKSADAMDEARAKDYMLTFQTEPQDLDNDDTPGFGGPK